LDNIIKDPCEDGYVSEKKTAVRNSDGNHHGTMTILLALLPMRLSLAEFVGLTWLYLKC